jgi:serine O-acetyltransferase
VTLYAHATVLGGTTVIGENSVVGASVLLADSLPPNSSVATGRLNVVKTREIKPRTTVALIANRA